MFTTLLLACLSSVAPVLPPQTPTGHTAHPTTPVASRPVPEQASITQRATALQQQLEQAVQTHRVEAAAARTMSQELTEVKTSVAELAPKQGFVSAAEKASYERTFAKAEQLLAARK